MNNSTSAEQMNSTVYLAFREPGFHLGLFLPALLFAILAFIGIPLNASLCWVTIKYRSSLRFKTCILLAMEAFFRIPHQLSHFHFLIIALSGINFIPIRLALPLQSYSIIGCTAGNCQVVVLSLDRLFSVLAPLTYRQLSERKYIFCLSLANFIVTAYYFVQLIEPAQKFPEWPCTGLIGDLLTHPGVGPFFWYTSFGIIGISIFAYLLVAILIRLKTEMTTEKQQKIYHSLFLIVFINLIAYVNSYLVPVLYKLSLLPLTQLQFWYINLFTCTFVMNIGAISNAPILYYNSIDYRKAYVKEFKKLIGLIKSICGRQQQHSLIRVTQQQSTIKIIPISLPNIK